MVAGVSSQLYNHGLTERSMDPVGYHQPGASPEWSLTATLARKAEVDLIPWKVSEATALQGHRDVFLWVSEKPGHKAASRLPTLL